VSINRKRKANEPFKTGATAADVVNEDRPRVDRVVEN
jgi:hypothetical protein